MGILDHLDFDHDRTNHWVSGYRVTSFIVPGIRLLAPSIVSYGVLSGVVTPVVHHWPWEHVLAVLVTESSDDLLRARAAWATSRWGYGGAELSALGENQLFEQVPWLVHGYSGALCAFALVPWFIKELLAAHVRAHLR